MLPQRPSGTSSTHATTRPAGSVGLAQPAPYETVKKRVLAKLQDRFDLSASKRMPPSLLKQSLRQQAEQIAEQEARAFAKPDRDRLIEEVLVEVMGYGPLEELFTDPTVRELMVTGPGSVIARREYGPWLPTSVKFRDESHVRATLDKIATHAEPVGPVMTAIVLFDMRLPNGFRVMAVIPPDALGQPATAAFFRESTLPLPKPTKEPSGSFPGLPPIASTGSTSVGVLKTVPASITASSRPGSDATDTQGPRSGSGDAPAASERANDPLARHRARILELLLSKLASLKVYDVARLDVTELRKVITAYIREYCSIEKLYISESDQGRLMLEILTSLQR